MQIFSAIKTLDLIADVKTIGTQALGRVLTLALSQILLISYQFEIIVLSINELYIGEIMDLDFIESSAQNIPKEHLKSSTVETLISQNEDLMLKFKTALRRLSTMEEQNQQLTEDHIELKRQNSILHDQTAVLKEKDQLWKGNFEQVETDRQLLSEKNLHLQDQNSNHLLEISRYQKYHEKIKTQVKPYLQQMRKYTGELESKRGVAAHGPGRVA